jgi:hypothetical protein
VVLLGKSAECPGAEANSMQGSRVILRDVTNKINVERGAEFQHSVPAYI